MIVEKILAAYGLKKEVPKGSPTGSRFGSCTAQLQMLLYPAVFHPEPHPARAQMMFEEGHILEDWWGRAIAKAFEGERAATLLEQEPFYFPVPLQSGAQVDTVARKIEERLIWGRVRQKFAPPTIRVEEGRLKLRLLSCQDCDTKGREHGWPCGKRLGLVLDLDASILWCPTYIDGVFVGQDFVTVLEKKAVSNFAFRRALMGTMEYRNRCQLVGMVEAMGVDATWLVYRKETAHILELTYSKRVDRARVELVRPNGAREFYDLSKGEPADHEYDAAMTWTPFDEGLAEQIRERIRRVVMFTGDPTTLRREYGPTFTCPTCGGTGTQVNAKTTGLPLKGGPKPCGDCQGGFLEEARLPAFPCGYCAVVEACWGAAKPELRIDKKPIRWIQRAAYEASGLTFTAPESTHTEEETP